jgi:hypothetical protein
VIAGNKEWGKKCAAGEFKPVFEKPEQLREYHSSQQPSAENTPALLSDSAMVRREAVTPLVGLILAAARPRAGAEVGQQATAASGEVVITPVAANQNQTGAIDRLDAPAGEVGSGRMASPGAAAGAEPMSIDGGVGSVMPGDQPVVLSSGLRVGPAPPLLPPPRPPPGSPVPVTGSPAPQPAALSPQEPQQSRLERFREALLHAPQLQQYMLTPPIRYGKPSIAPWACAQHQAEWAGVAAAVKGYLICQPEWKVAYFVVHRWPEVIHVVDLLQPQSVPQTMPLNCVPALPKACNLGEYRFHSGAFANPLSEEEWWVIYPKKREAGSTA